MKNEELHKILNQLWENKITEFEFDIFRNRIRFSLEWIDGSVKNEHIIHL